jgi:hypothetical protein
VARAMVTVFEPKLIISSEIMDGLNFTKITNEGSEEVNIGDFTLKSINKNFFIAKDTIIEAGGSISIPFVSEDGQVTLFYPNDIPFRNDPNHSIFERTKQSASLLFSNVSRFLKVILN